MKSQSIFESLHSVRARLHQTLASMQHQYSNDTNDTSLIEMNGVTPKGVASPFSSDPIDFNKRSIASVIAGLMPHR